MTPTSSNPGDIPGLMRPFLEEGADAVFGSRYLAASYRRALMHRHSVMNRMLTRVCNWFTDLDLTDVETCYKAVRTTPLRRFRSGAATFGSRSSSL